MTASERINGRTTAATACRHLGHAAERGKKTEGERERELERAKKNEGSESVTEREREREIKERELSPRSVYLSETEQSLSCSASVRIGARDGLTWLLRLKMSNACARSCVCVSVLVHV